MARKLACWVLWVGFGLMIAGYAGPAMAEERATEAEALALLDKAATFLRDQGLDAARATFPKKDGGFIDRDLYVTVLDRAGVMIVHAINPALNGKNLIKLTDVDGKLFIRDAIETAIAAGHGFVTYKWSDPLTKQVAIKEMHFRLVGDHVVSVGVYR